MGWVPYTCLFLLALAVVWLLTPLAAIISTKLGAVDYPGGRHIHTRPVPRMGGIAIFGAICAAAGLQWIGTTYWDWPVVLLPAPQLHINYYLVAASFVVMFLTGAIDDVVSLKPLTKLLGQIIAATIAVLGGLVIGDIVNPMGGELDIGWLSYPVTVLYLVAYANVINLIDGLDGLAAGIVSLASLAMFVLSVLSGRLDAAAIAIALCGASLGFLRFNFNPASIFMGDSGALLLGFALGTVSLLSVTRVAGLTTLLLPLVLAGIPILDTFSAIVRRKRVHVSVGQADRGHIHHRLIHYGFNQRQAVVIIYLWTAALCVGAIIMTQVELWPRVAIFLALVVASIIVAARLKLFRPVVLHHYDEERGADVLVTPDDPAFLYEARRQHVDLGDTEEFSVPSDLMDDDPDEFGEPKH